MIPTGGGKTYTAVKSVCELYSQGVLETGEDKVLWVAHREELVEQGKQTFQRWIQEHNIDLRVGGDILVEPITSGTRIVSSDDSVKLIVIDEAHHAAAPSYKPFFDQERAGVLGLTATPSRHDGKPLDFERESFSIGFPDLVKRGVIIRPTIHSIKGIASDVTDLHSEKELNKLNSAERNQLIIDGLLSKRDLYHKAVVYVGTKQHARDLYRQMNETSLPQYYDSISYVTGEENSRGLERKAFFDAEREETRSIIVNVQVLTEGYDDPSINAVVMAAPSRSKLYYMQALGRAIRHDPDNESKAAFVLEIDDQLPNIRYRIDNRWLYSDISDALEPAVIDTTYSDEKSFLGELKDLFLSYNVPQIDQNYPVYDESDRYSLLLFKQYVRGGGYRHRAVVLSGENRTRVVNAFNYISERAEHYVKHGFGAASVFETLRNIVLEDPFGEIDDRAVFDAVSNAAALIIKDCESEDFVSVGSPWITFCALHLHVEENSLPDDLLRFVADMANSVEVLERLERFDFAKTDVLLRLPLPLGGFYGLFVIGDTHSEVDAILRELDAIKLSSANDQISVLSRFRDSVVFPIEAKYFHSMTLIVRDDLEYHYPLQRLFDE
nr:hypothetical protein 8 [Halieaceae bacterium]